MAEAQRGLVRVLIAASGHEARLVRAESRSWASATFDGARHRLELAGPEEAVAMMVRGLDEREFSLCGQFVADIIVTSRTETEDDVTVMIEALTIVGT